MFKLLLGVLSYNKLEISRKIKPGGGGPQKRVQGHAD